MTTPPFQYGLKDDPATQTYTLVPSTAPPALVVWLFLVTQADFLQEAANPDSTLVPRDQIARYTNLQRSAVDAILDAYVSAGPALQQSFNDVATAFQDLCKENNGFWEVGECPHDATPMLWLASHGAAVDPSVQPLPFQQRKIATNKIKSPAAGMQ
jgi:hypothetical protein